MKKIIALLLLPLFAIASVPPAVAGIEPSSEPAKLVIGTIGEIRSTVKSHAAKSATSDLDALLEEIISPVFNFSEMSRRCLGKNWSKGTEQQQQEFTELFTKLLSETYLSKIRKIENSEISFVGERVKGPRAIVKTDVLHKEQEFPIHYRMRQRDGKWQVYDVVIENISLVSNYRQEFAAIVRKEAFEGLITRLREKRDRKSEG